MKQKIVNKYIRQIKRIYRGKSSDKKQFIEELQDALLCFCEEHPDSSYSDLVKEFGKPSEMKDILSFHSAEKLQKRNMFLYWTVNITVITATAILVFFTVHYMQEKYNDTHGYFIEYLYNPENGEPEEMNINPVTGETFAPIDESEYEYIDFGTHYADPDEEEED